MNDVTRYANMKDSGIWKLEDIPSGWKIIKIKYIATLDPYCESSNIANDSNVSFVPMECIKNNHIIERSSKKYKYNSSYSTFLNGDIAIAKVTPCFENGNIVIMKNLINGFGFGSSELFILRPFKVDTKFLFYALQSHSFKEGAVSIMTGTGGLKRVSSTYMKNAFIAMPPEYEQKRISYYLDSQCAKIDDIIAGARTSIEEYKKWKASVISEAVTKGLDPHAEMKDSGVEWIGKIPKHWQVTRLKNIASVARGGSPRPIEDYLTSEDSGLNWIKIGDTIKGYKYIDAVRQKIRHEGLSKTKIVHKGDLILTNSMSFGEPYILNIDACIHDGWVCIQDIHIEKEFLYYTLVSNLCKEQFKLQVSGGVVKNLNVDKIGIIYIFVPSYEEQKNIIDYLNSKCSEIDNLIGEKEALIADLESYKKSLIYEVVTGKRKVI